VPLLVLIYFCPESPRWYMKKSRYADAWKSMIKLHHYQLQAARDIYYISAQLEIEEKIVGKTNYARRFAQLFTIPRVRRANLAAFTVMIAQQMCGIDIIAFYSTSRDGVQSCRRLRPTPWGANRPTGTRGSIIYTGPPWATNMNE
jgi:hypothetical protein